MESKTTHLEDKQNMNTNNRKWWKKYAKWILALLVFIFVGYLFYFQSIPTAFVSRVEKKTARDIVLGIVEIKEYHAFDLRFEREGIVVSENCKVGAPVRKGDLLFELDTEEVLLAKEKLVLQKEISEALLELPQQIFRDYNRALFTLRNTKRLVREGTRPAKTLIDAERNVELHENAKAQLELNHKTKARLRDNDIGKVDYTINKMKLHSPINGIITKVNVRKGEFVFQGQEVVSLIDDRRLLVASLSEESYNQVSVGLPVELEMKAFPETLFKGQISQVLPVSDPEEKKFEIYIDANIPEKNMLPGLTGEVTIIFDEHENAIVVPSQAVFEGEVLKLNDQNRVEKIPVKTGFVNLMEIEILEGLEEGETVITESFNNFENGQRVNMEWE